MLRYICAHKTAYHKGQIFPFMLAVVAVLVIMFMITFNLGQIGFFKTDTSNAADAGALAGSSVISGALLGLGLANDAMAGEAYTTIAAAIVFIVCIDTIPLAIAILVMHISRCMLAFVQQWGASIQALGLARKNALQYAWQNAGVDVPRPSFSTFISNAFFATRHMGANLPFGKPGLFNTPGDPNAVACPSPESTTCTGQTMFADCANNRNGCTPDDLAEFQTIYENGYDSNNASNSAYELAIMNALKSDFGNFMGDDGSGWWQYGIPGVDNIPPTTIYSAYAWNSDATKPPAPSYGAGTCYGLKDNPGVIQDLSASYGYNYDNVVWIKVTGPVSYDFYMMQAPQLGAGEEAAAAGADPITNCLVNFIKSKLGSWIGWLFFVIDRFVEWLTSWISKMISDLVVGFPIAIIIDGEVNTDTNSSDQLTQNPMTVEVHRYKRPADLGMWKMTYGGAISGDVWSTSSVTLTRNYDNPTDTYVRGPTCASVMPACCYECDDRGLRVPSDPLDAALCGLLTNILNGESIKNALKGVFINTSDRHLFESTITSVDTNRQ